MIKKIDKTLEAETITLLKHMLTMELRRLCDEHGIDMAFFMGVDGRIFTSHIPRHLTSTQFHLLNLTKTNIPHICGQLQAENMKVSVQQFNEGTIMISGVGDNAFLVSIMGMELQISELRDKIDAVSTASAVLKHLLEVRPVTDEAMEDYPEEVSTELRKLSRMLFKEKFAQTKQYKKNMEVLSFLKGRIESVCGVGAVDEIVTLVLNELGTAPAYMNDKQWRMFTDKVINDHVRKLRGDIIADDCLRSWVPEVERKLKSFV